MTMDNTLDAILAKKIIDDLNRVLALQLTSETSFFYHWDGNEIVTVPAKEPSC
jgi:hypothetical protein